MSLAEPSIVFDDGDGGVLSDARHRHDVIVEHDDAARVDGVEGDVGAIGEIENTTEAQPVIELRQPQPVGVAGARICPTRHGAG